MRHYFLKFSLLLWVTIAATTGIGCQRPLYKDSEFIMGTLVEVISPDPRAKTIVFSEFRRLQDIFNLFDEKSELSRLNITGHLKVSPDLFEILKKAKEFYETTDGAFDVTVAPLSLLWKKAIRRQQLPAEEEVRESLELVGFDYVYLDEKNQEVRLLKAKSQIDLGAIAKGYAVDQAVSKLKEMKILSAIVNAGGDLAVLGEDNKRLWRIAIRDPNGNKHLMERLELKNGAVATSGDYEQFFEFQNKRYSHIIDPKTGYPTDSGIVSATVLAADATTADALATSLVILGIKKGIELLRLYPGTHAKLIDEHGKIYNL